MSLTQEQINNRIEFILDKIAEAIILNSEVTPQLVNQNQKTIRNGLISIGKENSDRLVLFQKDIKANQEDLNSTDGTHTLSSIVSDIPDISQATISAEDLGSITLTFANGNGGTIEYDITNILSEITTNDDGTETILNPLNVSQFISISPTATDINSNQANEFLDTNIYELLPDSSTRQQRIDDAFAEIRDLLPPELPQFDLDADGRVDRDMNTESENFGNWISSEQYYLDNSISATQENTNANIEEKDAYITRLADNENDLNDTKSIESLRNQLNLYLRDIDEAPALPQDDREIYQNQSDGYLKFRNLNQGIIIRNANQEFVEGLNPTTRDFLQTGFTITMWVRFLDKTSIGTLFNFGNPTRVENPFGFKLETYVINRDDVPRNSSGNFVAGFGVPANSTWGEIFQNGGMNVDGNQLNYDGTPPQENFFENSDTERFVRLVVNDGERIRGSHIGLPFFNRRAGLPEFPELSGGYDYYTDAASGPYDHSYGLMTNTRIPVNFNEWYFICATFNPSIQEDASHPSPSAGAGLNNTSNEIYNLYQNNKSFWMNHINPATGESDVNSNFGNKCKVEIISKTDLLRARGFKV